MKNEYITAIKNGTTRRFTQATWKFMGRSKRGWKVLAETPEELKPKAKSKSKPKSNKTKDNEQEENKSDK